MISPKPLPCFVDRRTADHRGFTLVELLVVIVIIAILAAIIFPVVSSMMRQGNQTASAANLRQWYSGFGASLGDNDGSMPSDGAANGFNPGDQTAWFNRIPLQLKITPCASFGSNWPRLHSKSIWVNPQVPLSASPGGSFIFCYAFNTYLSNATQINQKFANVEHPDRTILMSEKADLKPDLDPTTIRSYFGSGNPTDPLVDINNAANILFCDGHVQLVKRSVFGAGQTYDPNFYASSYDQLPLTWLPNATATQ